MYGLGHWLRTYCEERLRAAPARPTTPTPPVVLYNDGLTAVVACPGLWLVGPAAPPPEKG
jgi:hypothetical protein